jgi:protocatechuate 3,4-dioxygenase beta subunit
MAKYFLHLFCFALVFGCGRTASTQNSNKENNHAGKDAAEIQVGSRCDGCEMMFEGMPAVEKIPSSTRIAGGNEPGERLEISGKVFLPDGNTPAKDIILYLYQTDASGKYSPGDTQTIARRHGHLRSWVKTGEDGSFHISTIRPASYPNTRIPQHIHIFVKEPGKSVYYIDEVWFDDDPMLTDEMKNKSEKRGGNMLVQVSKNAANVWMGNMNIILGMNIPNYK